MLLKTLTNLGLNTKEAQIYLASLELGSSPVSQIAARAKLNRVTAYDIIEKLVKRGLFSFVTKRKIKYFTATDPEVVVADFTKKSQELAKVLPDLKRLHGTSVHPRVRYFEGVDGIKNIYTDTLTSTTEILNYCNSREIRTFWPEYDEEYVQERAKKQIHLRGIALNDAYGKTVHDEDTKFCREIRLIPEGTYNFTNEIHIYDDKVAIISLKDELIGMIIESHEIASSQRAIFQAVWNFAAMQNGINATSQNAAQKNETPAPPTREHRPLEKKAETPIAPSTTPSIEQTKQPLAATATQPTTEAETPANTPEPAEGQTGLFDL